MLEGYASDIWWNQISGPSALVKQITQTILDNQSLYLVTHPDSAWRRQLRYTCQKRLTEDYQYTVDVFDFEEGMTERETPESFLLRQIPEDISKKFKPHKETHVSFLKNSGVFKGTVVWVKGIPDTKVDEWITFLREWKKTSSESGLFVINVNDTGNAPFLSKNVDTVKDRDFITPYDTQVFLFLRASGTNEYRTRLNYKVSVIASLCGKDGEVADKLLESLNVGTEDPVETLETLKEKHFHSSPRGSYDPNLEEHQQHPFYLIGKNDTNTLSKRLWKAQLQILFPLLEEARMDFVHKYWNAIEKHLPLKDVYNGEIDNVYDMELGHLIMITGKQNSDNETLFIDHQEDYDHLLFLKKIRNTLAHNQTCTPSQADRVLKGHEFEESR